MVPENPRRGRRPFVPLVFGVGFAVILLIESCGLYFLLSSVPSFGWVDHSYMVLLRAEHVLYLITKAESLQRGFLVTGKEESHTAYRQTVLELKEALSELERNTASDKRQSQLIVGMRPLLEVDLSALERAMEMHRDHSETSGPVARITEESQTLMEQIRDMITGFISRETELLLDREHAFQKRTETATLAVGSGLIATTLLTGFAGVVLYRRSRELEAVVTICAWTKRVKREGEWVSIEDYLWDRFHLRLSHGISEEAARELNLEAMEHHETGER